jgi:hypothetical protein
MIFGLTKRGEKNCRKPETKFIELQLGVENCFGFQKSFVVCFVSKLFQYITYRKKHFLIRIFKRVINLKIFFFKCLQSFFNKSIAKFNLESAVLSC